MEKRTVLTAIGEDRPGLVEEVSEFVLARGGSIEDSRMADLGGQFAMMMLIAGSPDTIDRITGDVDTLAAAAGIRAQLTPASGRPEAPAAATRHRLTGRALDQPGLVHEVANVLRRFGVNIESMDTTLEAAPITGAPTFAMELVLAVPVKVSLAELTDELGRACDGLNIDWDLAPAGAAHTGA